jgi:glyoxalase family protein
MERTVIMQKLQTQGVHHITLVGADRQTSIDFWEGVLGMPFLFEQPNLDDPEQNHLYFDPGDGRLITCSPARTANPTPPPTRPASAACTTSPSSCRAPPTPRPPERLTDRGLTHSGEVDRGFMYSLYFRDPLGLLIELACYKFDPPVGATHADVLHEAHKIRVERGDPAIADDHLADAIEAMIRKRPSLSKGPFGQGPVQVTRSPYRRSCSVGGASTMIMVARARTSPVLRKHMRPVAAIAQRLTGPGDLHLAVAGHLDLAFENVEMLGAARLVRLRHEFAPGLGRKVVPLHVLDQIERPEDGEPAQPVLALEDGNVVARLMLQEFRPVSALSTSDIDTSSACDSRHTVLMVGLVSLRSICEMIDLATPDCSDRSPSDIL